MTISLQTPRWTNPKLTAAQKIELAKQVEKVGAKKLALRMCPPDKARFSWAIGGIVVGMLIVILLGNVSKHFLVAGTFISLLGFIMLPVAIYGTTVNYINSSNWLAEIGKYYGRDRAKYGN